MDFVVLNDRASDSKSRQGAGSDSPHELTTKKDGKDEALRCGESYHAFSVGLTSNVAGIAADGAGQRIIRVVLE